MSAAQQKFTVRFHLRESGADRVVHVAPGDLPNQHDGEPGSLLQIALAAGTPIEHACGGVGACATCHVIVREGGESCSPPGEAEEDMLDRAPGVTPQSRLACKAVPDGSADLVVEVPAWNRNLAGEGR